MKRLIGTIVLTAALLPVSLKAQPAWRVFSETAAGEVVSRGWMRELLQVQADGLSGHIAVAGKPFDKVAWGSPSPGKEWDKWSYYEQTAYWADGSLRLSYLTGNDALKASVRKWIDDVISNPAPDGYLGPDIENMWPHVVFFRAVLEEYRATSDKRILDALARHYRDSERCRVIFSGNEKGFGGRNFLNVEILCRLYEMTGDAFFLDKAESTYKAACSKGGNLSLDNYASDKVPAGHSISSIEALKIPVILYCATGKEEYLGPAVKGLEKMIAYHALADGVPTGNEQHDGNNPRGFHETCAVSDFQWTLGWFLEATGDVRWADQMERVCFNAAMGVVSKDFRSHQYYGSTNQVIASDKSSPAVFTGGADRVAYKINHVPACCTGNVSRMIPLFCSRQWMRRGEDIVAALYAPSVLKTKVSGKEVSVEQKTDYPFGETVTFTVRTKGKQRFSFWLRIPSWCEGASVSINGQPSGAECKAGSFVELDRTFKDGDCIILSLPMAVRMVKRPFGGVSVERGPLLFCLPVKEKEKVTATRRHEGEEFKSVLLTPASKWNYALSGKENAAVVVTDDFSSPWDIEKTPVRLRLKGTEVKNWQLYRGNFTPDLPSSITPGESAELELVPFGTTRLRISVFPDMDTIPATEF